MSRRGGTLPGVDEICVWSVALHRAAREPVTLTAAECRIAGSIRSGRARARYVAGRTLLRRRLGWMLGRDPIAVEIVYGPDEKPVLADPVVSFNVSHAGDQILIAVSRSRRLGVDVERIRRDFDLHAVSEELLARADREAIARAAAREGVRAFFRYWTRYEALVKARGDGLVVPLRGLAEVAAGFEVRELDVTRGYVAAVAADGNPWRVVRCG
jgi:4'-phosphopantetheinyl transferase